MGMGMGMGMGMDKVYNPWVQIHVEFCTHRLFKCGYDIALPCPYPIVASLLMDKDGNGTINMKGWTLKIWFSKPNC
jgi:hypothetical protein